MKGSRALFALAVALLLGAAVRDRFDAWIDATDLPPLVTETSVEVLDRNGGLLRAYTVADGRWRLAVRPDQVDPNFIRMLLAYEDKRFLQHSGIDLAALIRASFQSLMQGKTTSGGSTITMQTARLLEDGATGTWSGKLRQIRVAIALERRLAKPEILTMYLNRAPYGGNLEGVRAAARAWFAKEPVRMTPAEAALLVALPQSPETRRPDRDPLAARAARNRVLDRMQRAGVLDAETVRNAKTETILSNRYAFPVLAAHLSDRSLAADPLSQTHHLTIDAMLQSKLEGLARHAAEGAGDRLSVAILVADHGSGEILASVGSAGYQEDQRQGFVDMTQAVRSPGSTLKPLIYGMAFDQGLANPETLIEDRPTTFGSYAPQNFDGLFRGTIRIRDALKLSLNIPAVSLTEALGPAVVLARMRRAGVVPHVSGGTPGLAIALGGIGISLQDLTQLFAAIARGGQAVTLVAEVGPAQAAIEQQVLSRSAAWQVADILSDLPPPANSPANRLAYKTGTSYGHRDAWAIGFDGRHVIGIWMGRPDGTPVPGAFGGNLAAPILFEAFSRLKPTLDPLPPPPPETLIVSNAALPLPLQHFRPRDAVFEPAMDGPKVAYPPNGARLVAEGALTVKVRDGKPPFSWLANGMPVATGSFEREQAITRTGLGFLRLSVVDANGQADSVEIRLD